MHHSGQLLRSRTSRKRSFHPREFWLRHVELIQSWLAKHGSIREGHTVALRLSLLAREQGCCEIARRPRIRCHNRDKRLPESLHLHKLAANGDNLLVGSLFRRPELTHRANSVLHVAGSSRDTKVKVEKGWKPETRTLRRGPSRWPTELAIEYRIARHRITINHHAAGAQAPFGVVIILSFQRVDQFGSFAGGPSQLRHVGGAFRRDQLGVFRGGEGLY